MTQRIAYPNDNLQALMWLAAVKAAIETPAIVAAFEKESGKPFLFGHPRSLIEIEIDKTTGADSAAVAEFIDWFNIHVWGEDPFSPAKSEDA